MSLSHAPSVVTNGLNFYYDMNNVQKSWKGAPTTNVYPNSITNYGITNFALANSAAQDPLGTFTASSWTISNTASTSQFWYPYISTIDTYTYSVWLKSSYPTTVWLYPQGTDESEKVAVLVTTEWKRFSVTRTQAIAKTVGGLIRIQPGTFSGTLFTWGHQLEAQPFVTPLVTTAGVAASRSNTQAILDITGTQTLTPNNIAYNSDGSFSFNGTNSFINGNTGIDVKTVIAWIKLGALGNDGIVYGLDANGADNWLGLVGNSIEFKGTQFADVNNFSFGGTTVLNTSQFYQIACTIEGNTAKIYCNGVQEGSATQSFTIGSWNAIPYIGIRGSVGQRPFLGTIASVSTYSRALSSQEIFQNFTALKGRYGI